MANMKHGVLLLLMLALGLPAATAQNMMRTRTEGVNDNIFKFDPLQIAHGEFGLHYERRLLDQLGIEVGAGATLRDYYWHGLRSIVGEDYLDPARITQYNTGLAVRGAIRLYPTAEADQLTRLFLGLGMQHKQYSWQSLYEGVIPQIGDMPRDITVDESRQLTDIQVLFGQQHFLNSNMLVEYFAGAVLRFQTLEGAQFEDWETMTGLERAHTESTTMPGLILGFRIGYGF